MADRIERYLGRLEAELEGRVDGARLEEILVEVEGHLRDNEDAYRELGEPDDLANRLAVDGFGGVAELSLQVQHGERASGATQKFGEVIRFIGSFLIVCWAVMVPTIFADSGFWSLIFPEVALVIACFLAKGRVWRQIIQGALAAGVCVLVLFLSIGRLAYSGGEPILGLSLTGSQVMSGGQVHSVVAAQQELEEANVLVKDAERYNSVAHEGPPNFLRYLAIQDGRYSPVKGRNEVMSISMRDGFYGYKFTTDYLAARETWLIHGESFIEHIRGLAFQAKNRLEVAEQLQESTISANAFGIVLAVTPLLGGAVIVLSICGGIGLGLRRIVDGIEQMVKKVTRYGIQK